jgi:hypothetical protein
MIIYIFSVLDIHFYFHQNGVIIFFWFNISAYKSHFYMNLAARGNAGSCSYQLHNQIEIS